MKLSIAVAGKGGTGKTTFSALLVRALKEATVKPVLAVDADPNSTLADALGVEDGRPLADIREQSSTPEGSPASGMGRARAVEDEIQRAITEAEGFDLVTMGHPEGPRCYCYVNTLLRKSLDELSKSYNEVVVDNEAGLEHLSRRTTNDVDFLVAVMNPTMPSFRAAQRVLSMCEQLPVNIGRTALLVTRVSEKGIPEPIQRELDALDVWRLPDIPQDDAIESAGAVGESVFGVDGNAPAVAAVRQVLETLQE